MSASEVMEIVNITALILLVLITAPVILDISYTLISTNV